MSHVGLDWDTIVQLVSKGYDRIVNNYNIFEVTVLNDTKIFHVNSVAWINAMLTIKSMLDYLTIWINEVETRFSEENADTEIDFARKL